VKKYFAGLMILGLLAGGANLIAQEKPPAPAKAQAAPAPRGRGPMGPGPMAQAPIERLKQWLDLTPDQVAKLQDARKARQEEQKAFQDQMRKLRGELAPLVRDPKADPGKVNGLIDQIAKLSAERAKKAYAGRLALEKILTPEQMTKLRSLPGRGMGMRQGMGMRRGVGPMGRGTMMGPRGGMMMGRGPGMRMGARQGLNLRMRLQRWLRGWGWIR
jgi:Spy/CpxP family protein refolding chaperone